jgi:DNA-binding response OmpR family regulator
MTYKLLLVEDDQFIGSLIEAVFSGKGYKITWFSKGKDAVDNFRKDLYDICILDYSLPDMDGFTLNTKLKAIDDIPFLFVTANQETEIKYKAFEHGCDDFILKPFQTRELVLRVEAILRRCKKRPVKDAPDHFNLGDFSFDHNSRVINYAGKVTKLGAKESHIMKLMLENANKVVMRKTLMEEIWGVKDSYTSKCLDVYLSKLRKILRESTPLEILNEHGVGYKIVNLKNN